MASIPRNISEAIQLVTKDGGRALTELSHSRIRDHVHLNAFTFITSTKKEGAKNGQGGKRPLEGIPIAVKDNFCVREMPTTCGSEMLHNFVPPYTATVVQKLVDNGAVIMGKTNMDEFGMGNGTVDSVFGPTKNPWGLTKFLQPNCPSSPKSFSDWHVPGGSSGGSAVAVASGMCLGALGSDTGGSTRNPASYCGVYGLKPTYGSISRHGLIPLVNSMDVPGILARTAEDCAKIYDTIKGWDPLDSTTVKDTPTSPTLPHPDGSVEGIRIGLPREYLCEGMSPEIVSTWKEIGDMLSREGAIVSEVSLPHTKYSIVCYSILNPAEVASNMARYDGLRYGHRATKKSLDSTEALFARTRHEGFNSVVRGRILAGNYFLLKKNYDKYFLQALRVRRLIAKDFEQVLGPQVDLLLTPVTLSTAPTYSEFSLWDNRKQSSVQDYCTQSANMAGLPALSIPIKLSASGLPISLQLIGQKFGEKRIFQAAQRIEHLVNFSHSPS